MIIIIGNVRKIKKEYPKWGIELNEKTNPTLKLVKSSYNQRQRAPASIHIFVVGDFNPSSSTGQLLNSFVSSNFLVCQYVSLMIFAIIFPLCQFLQTENTDLASSLRMVSVVHAEIKTIRSKCESEFGILFEKMTTITAEMKT